MRLTALAHIATLGAATEYKGAMYAQLSLLISRTSLRSLRLLPHLDSCAFARLLLAGHEERPNQEGKYDDEANRNACN